MTARSDRCSVATGLPKDWRHEIEIWAAAEPTIGKVWLFGSRAKGGYRPDSDIDLAVEMVETDAGAALADFIVGAERWREIFEGRLPATVSFSPCGHSDDPVEPAVKEHGVLIYDRSPAEFAR